MYSQLYKRYVTTLLLAIYLFNQADRNIFAILMEPIKRALSLSDTQLGFLAGPALVLLYVTLGVPVARIADRSHRVNIMSLAIAVWSSIVMLSGTVAKFWQLAATRIGVGIGEAGFAAIAQSVIADYHTASERARALSFFMLGIPLGGVLTYLMGGWINQAYGWRLAFVMAGLPGLLLCLLLKLTVQEPPRDRGSEDSPASELSLASVLQTLWRNPSLRHLAIAQGLVNITVSCERSWFPAFLSRHHGMASGEIGTWLAAVEGIGGGAGIWLGGYLASRYSSNDGEGTQTRVVAVVTLLAIPLILLSLWCPAKLGTLLFLFPTYVAMMFFLGPLLSLIQSLSPSGARATMVAVFIFVQVLLGGVIGIQLLGILSDVITPHLGSAAALRWSMTAVTVFAAWAAVHFWLAGRSSHAREDPAPAEVM